MYNTLMGCEVRNLGQLISPEFCVRVCCVLASGKISYLLWFHETRLNSGTRQLIAINSLNQFSKECESSYRSKAHRKNQFLKRV